MAVFSSSHDSHFHRKLVQLGGRLWPCVALLTTSPLSHALTSPMIKARLTFRDNCEWEITNIQRVLNQRWCTADRRAQQLTEIAYSRLHLIAQRLIGCSDGTPTLGATALVNEGYAKMILAGQFHGIRDAGHFYARFTLSMKHIIIDYFRSRHTLKNGGQGWRRQAWLDALEATVDPMFAELDLLDALEKLGERYPQCAVAFEHQFFGRLTVTEIMQVTGENRSKVEADLRFAKAYLRVQYDARF